ncbi:MAG: SUMF1/EgtB/PvdO family nonheme iron enzyme [Candidatus Competibacteraceae bacterium]
MSTSNNISHSPRHLKVFLASPGDVADERGLALTVLEQLQYDPLLRGRITVETVAWDKPGAGTPMLATLTPQEAIAQGLPEPAKCDIVIVIFWSRMGTPLPSEWKKADGSRYLSGTEWEYLNALEAAERQGKPTILVYRRTEKITLDPDDPDFEAKTQQWKLVKQFFQTFENPDGAIKRGHNAYRLPEDFREQLNQHLRAQVRELLEREAPIAAVQPEMPAPLTTSPPLWPGSPFPGLRAFTPDDAPIYFGRGRETDELVNKLVDPAIRFLAVVGASGSGKSSLVAAGLIPRLMAGAIVGSQDWTWVRFTPGEVGDNPFMALALSFKDVLQPHGQQPRELAGRLEKDPAVLIELRDLALAGKPAWAELLLFIDQFEELFTLVAPRHVGPFIALLRKAVQTARLRLVATLRADFYHRCVEQISLAELLRTLSYPLAAPGPGALHEMITRPAERAGLSFEPGLVERILDDTGTEPGALALLAFALAELYAARVDGRLTWAAYNNFQGVKGAIAQRAETTMSRLGIAPSTVGEVFQELVEIEEGGTVTRRRAPWARLVKSAEAEKLVTAFIDARLLVASRGEDGKPVVEVAHEALFTAWKTLRDWLDKHREQLKAGQDLEEAAQEWQALGKRSSALASGARLKRYRQAIKPSVLADQFLHASRRRLWRQRGLAGVVAALLLTLVGLAVWFEIQGWTVQQGTSLVLAKLGFYYVPEMVEIPPGGFWMGSQDDDPQADKSEKPRHQVKIEKRFAIGKYEVTFREYDQFALDTGRDVPNDSNWGRGQRPVINVSWEDAVAYVAWLSEKTGDHYRLPTEAEWEYACRVGKETTYCFEGNEEQLGDYAWYDKNSEGRTHPVGWTEANSWGLHDMSGNVWEWVQDCWHDSYKGAPVDGSAWEKENCEERVLRGGSWLHVPTRLRGAARGWNYPHARGTNWGFRLARTFP